MCLRCYRHLGNAPTMTDPNYVMDTAILRRAARTGAAIVFLELPLSPLYRLVCFPKPDLAPPLARTRRGHSASVVSGIDVTDLVLSPVHFTFTIALVPYLSSERPLTATDYRRFIEAGNHS